MEVNLSWLLATMAAAPTTAIACAWLDLRYKIRRLEEKVAEHNKFDDRLRVIEIDGCAHRRDCDP